MSSQETIASFTCAGRNDSTAAQSSPEGQRWEPTPFDPELHYGAGDDNALYNIFATWPDNFFSSLPKPHGNRGVDEPYLELRQSQIFLDDCFRGKGTRRCCTTTIPCPDKLDRDRMRQQVQLEEANTYITPKALFRSALDLAREQAKLGSSLANALARHRRTSDLRRATCENPSASLSLLQRRDRQEHQERDDNSDTGSSTQSQSNTILNPPIPGPLTSSIEALQSQVNNFAKENGFGVVRRNGSGSSVRKTRYVFECDRYGQPRPSRGAGLRQKRSRKCGCKWKVVGEALEENNYMWTLREFADLQHSKHNHGRSISLSAHPIHRRLSDSVKATVEAISRRVGIRARDIRGVVKEKHPGTVYTRKDIYNARALLRREKLDGLSPTAALIKLFDERSIPYIVKWSDAEPDRLVGLIWTFPYCLRMWKRFPEIMSFDNTYNTNRFKLPLFQVTGQTCLKSIYNAAFGLIDNERREGFQFLAEGLRQLIVEHEIQSPDVIITDYDKQMKAALDSQFPGSQQQICIHHVNSNVLLNAKRRWKDAEEEGDGCGHNSSDSERSQAALTSRDMEAVRAVGKDGSPPLRTDHTSPVPHNYRGVLELWKFVVFAQTKDDYEKAWARLCDEFNDQQIILMYLYNTYLPVSAQWAHCFIKKYRNFGVRVTSGTEASNNNVKSYLLNGMSNLYGLVEAIEGMLADQQQDFLDNCSQDEVLTARAYSGPGSEYLGELRMVMSQPGLSLLAREHRHAVKSIPSRSCPWPEPIGKCNEDCTVSWQLGIPCSHTIYNKLEAGTFLTKWDVHPRWHLREPTSRNPYRRILDPKVATSLRGRPKNATQPVPESMVINRPASQSRDGLAAAGKTIKESKVTRKKAALGPGKQTGVRQAGRRRQLSVRRTRSEWEIISEDEAPEPAPKRQRRGSRRVPAASMSSAATNLGHETECEDCINVRL
ncbi:mutator-like element [Pochonia chlamydosporia 170]|uniref:Mutator-like element n=1 Tax=Pochonia chlamydosporia 170 TaxID=1380566 RepID=A0A219AP70_METCM|nr:mutator-like element [Pochonia chlamydosporia 170]OWT42543.1 mutator-like element [Pochonia chlamydosporia 170]